MPEGGSGSHQQGSPSSPSLRSGGPPPGGHNSGGGAQQFTVGSVRARAARVSTLGSLQRFTQGAVVGNDPLPASPTPWWRSNSLPRSGVFAAPAGGESEQGAGTKPPTAGAELSPPAEWSLRSGVGGVGGGWCPPTAGMPEACLIEALLLAGDLAQGGAQQLTVGSVRVRSARVSLLGSHQCLLRVSLLGTTPSQPPPLRGGGANAERSPRSAVGPISFPGRKVAPA